MLQNITKQYLLERGEVINDDKWRGWCGQLADAVAASTPEAVSIIYVDGRGVWDSDWCWSYHMVPMKDTLIHDAWCPKDEPLPLREWLLEMFGPDVEVTVTIDADDVFTGLTQDFTVH